MGLAGFEPASSRVEAERLASN